MLEVRDLVKHYRVGDGEPVRAVDGASLNVCAGEMVALYGPSGSGKTTLLMLIAGLLEPDSGAVLVGGRDLAGLSEDERARYRLRDLGLMDQGSELLPGGTAVQNAALKLLMVERARVAHKRVRPLLVRLGLGGRLDHRADQLSMGERQRVALARALSTHPKLLLADEPTGNLDSRRGGEVLGLLAQTAREMEMAVLLVTHDPQAAGLADRVLSLQDGRIAQGEPDKLLVRDGGAEVGG